MPFSYSFHLSAKSHAVSTVGKICQCSRHNLREYKSDHYDRSQIEVLAGSTASILEDVKRVYEDEFNDCLKKYNEDKRADRQIKNYLEHVSNSRSDVAAEIIIQIGDMEFWADKSLQQRKQMSYIFKDQLQSLQKLCPEFKIASAVIHYDESSPHMHVIGVPIATDYKRGMEKQVAKTKVFTADRLSYLQDKMRENAEKGMELNADLFHGKQLKAKSKGRNKDIPKQSLAEYYEIKTKTEEALIKKDSLNAEIAILRDEIVYESNVFKSEKERLRSEAKALKSEIETLQETSELLVTIHDYENCAEETRENIQVMQKTVSLMDEHAKLFKEAAAHEWIKQMQQVLNWLRNLVEVQLAKLRLFERKHDMPPEERKSRKLDDMIKHAEAIRNTQFYEQLRSGEREKER